MYRLKQVFSEGGTLKVITAGAQIFGVDNLTGVQLEGDLGEILAIGAEILPYIGLREKWESPLIFFFFFLVFDFASCKHTIDKV